jgi:hypothetical protein
MLAPEPCLEQLVRLFCQRKGNMMKKQVTRVQGRSAFSWRRGCWWLLLISVPRVWLVLRAQVSGQYQWVSLIFVVMLLLPLVCLNRAGRRQIGWQAPRRYWALPLAFLCGAMGAAGMFVVAETLFAGELGHWFAYVARSYTHVPNPLTPALRWQYVVIYAGISMSFSPLGEEVFYRGWVHEHFASRWGGGWASLIDSVAFGMVHLAHFGIVYVAGQWQFLPLPALLWVLLLVGNCLAFYQMRRLSGSIWGAVLAHMGFNLSMNVGIFFWLW